MDDTFTFVAPAMPGRQYDPFAVRLAAGALVATLLLGSFGVFLVAHERASDARRAARQAEARDASTAAVGREAAAAPAGGILDAEARDSLERALALARAVLREDGTFDGAGPVALAELQPSLVFVDGPSTAPGIVSVAGTHTGWAASASGPSGTCYWVRATVGGKAFYGTGDVCTGAAAFGAVAGSW